MRKIFALAAALLVLAGCSQHKDIEVVSYELASLNPQGFKSATATVRLEISNPRAGFRIQDMKATVYRRGEEFARISSPSTVRLDGHRTSEVTVDLEGSIVGNIGLFDVLGLVQSKDFSVFTVSYSATVKDCLGFRHKVSGKDLSISDLLHQLDTI